MRLILESRPASVGVAVSAVQEFAIQAGLTRLRADALGIAVDEAVTNIIRHAHFGRPDLPLTVSAISNAQSVAVEIRDTGEPFDPFSRFIDAPEGDAETRAVGGLGLLLMRELVDEAQYSREGKENMLILRMFKSDPKERGRSGPA